MTLPIGNDFLERMFDRWIPEPNSGCFLWVASQTSAGYGNCRAGYAHRLSYESEHGEGSAAGLLVRHRCDNPCCVNPDHLVVGTHSDNARDKIERGRDNSPKGERHQSSTITEAQARLIRGLAVSRSATQISVAMGVDRKTVYGILSGNTWSHLGPPIKERVRETVQPPRRAGEEAHAAKLTNRDASEIKRRLRAGALGVELAIEFGVLPTTISAIKTGRNWAWL